MTAGAPFAWGAMERVAQSAMETLVQIAILASGAAAFHHRRRITRYLKAEQEKMWGVRFEEGEPRTWFVALLTIVWTSGGLYLLWARLVWPALRQIVHG